MAKGKSTVSGSNKITFGKRKGGHTQKTFNKHNNKEKNYRGQGR